MPPAFQKYPKGKTNYQRDSIRIPFEKNKNKHALYVFLDPGFLIKYSTLPLPTIYLKFDLKNIKICFSL